MRLSRLKCAGPRDAGADRARATSPASIDASRFDALTPNGRIQRSDAARHAFARQTGYVIDHIVPLACGGADAPSNMQWQTVAAAKDKTEPTAVAGGRAGVQGKERR